LPGFVALPHFFAPLPCILAVVLSYSGALAYLAIAGRKRAGIPLSLFNGKLRRRKFRVYAPAKWNSTAVHALSKPGGRVDLANKYDLADTDEPVWWRRPAKNSPRARRTVREAGAYLHAADGEGVVAVFGFPGALNDHAEKAVHAAFDLARAFARNPSGSNGQNAAAGAHVGVSSGSMITAPQRKSRTFLCWASRLS